MAIKAIIFDFYGVLCNYSIDRELVAYIRELKKTYQIGLLSNNDHQAMLRILEEVEITNLFDAVVTSGKTGFYKPQKESYKAAALELGIEVGEAIFVDDSPIRVEGSEQAGMPAILYTGLPALKVEIERLTEQA